MRLAIDDVDDALEGRQRQRLTTPDERFAETVTAASRAAKGLTASVLADPKNLDTALADVSPDDLRDDFARTVFEHAREVYLAGGRRGIPLDRVAVRVTATGRYGQLATVARDLADLYQSGGAGVDAEYYLRAVRVTNRQLDLYTAAQIIIRDVMDVDSDKIDPADMESLAQSALAAADAPTTNGPRDIGDVIRRTLDNINDRHIPGRPKPIYTGIRDLDGKLVGFEPGELIIISARPGCGKTAIGMNVSTHNAANGLPVLFFSLEMSDTQLGERVATSETGANAGRLRSGRGIQDDFNRVIQVTEIVDGWPLLVMDWRTLTVARLVAEAKRIKRKHGLRLVIVDYLQLIRPADRKVPRWEQVGQISRDLKAAAGELQVPIIALAQLNREVENRSDGKPRLSDLRESGDLEQDADTVLLMSKVSGQSDNNETLRVCVQVAKQRSGQVGECDLMFVKSRLRFECVPAFGMGNPTQHGR